MRHLLLTVRKLQTYEEIRQQVGQEFFDEFIRSAMPFPYYDSSALSAKVFLEHENAQIF
jgi:hypothetical protein